jgi:hypothetical protein
MDWRLKIGSKGNDIFYLFKTLDNPEILSKGGCWAIITQVNDFLYR